MDLNGYQSRRKIVLGKVVADECGNRFVKRPVFGVGSSSVIIH